jgi:hypothetical protein
MAKSKVVVIKNTFPPVYISLAVQRQMKSMIQRFKEMRRKKAAKTMKKAATKSMKKTMKAART